MKKQISSAVLFLAAASAAILAVPGGNALAQAVAPGAAASARSGNTRDVLFNDDWKFFKGDDKAASGVAFEDGKWRTLDLPHDWSVESPFDQTLASCTAFLPCGIGWYRKHFTVPADAAGKAVSIRFDGVMNHSTVWCNGVEVGGRPYGYSSFTCDLSKAIKPGADNVIAVRVDHTQYADSRWYAGSGIYRNVWLSVLDPVHVVSNGVYVTTPKISADQATVATETLIAEPVPTVAGGTLSQRILDPQGNPVATKSVTFPKPTGAGLTWTEELIVPNPTLWSPAHPAMYSLVTEIRQGGAVVDTYTTPFGIRSFKFDPAKGFSINGESMKLKGVCLHHDMGALGGAVPLQVWETRLKLLQAAGVNAIRCSHNPPDPAVLDLYDRMGFLVMDEAFDEWTGGKHKWILAHNQGEPGTDGYHSDFDKWADIDIKDMVTRDRNHPSIIMWSIGNEIDYTNDPWPINSPELPPIAARLIADVKSVDTTRPVTAACAFPATNLFKQLLDIEGYNYMERLYPGDHAATPNAVIYGSENSQALATWQAVAQNDYIAGQFLWTGADYLGEAGAWPAHGSGAGLITLANFPKNQYYFRQSLWSDKPMVYLSTTGLGGRGGRGGPGGGAAGPGAPGGAAGGSTISCFTNCDSVELFQDGKSLGSKPHAVGDITTWPVTFNSGVLKAVGKKGDATVNFELKHAGAAAKLALVPDVQSLKADGKDVAQIELDVNDADGVLVSNAAAQVTCTISGPGRVLGIESGNLSSTDAYQSLTHTTYQGRLKIYVQAGKAAGEIKLTASGADIATGTVTIPVR